MSSIISFPLSPVTGAAVSMEMAALLSLATQTSALVRRNDEDLYLGLTELFEQHNIPVYERGQAVRELAVGFSLSQAFLNWKRVVEGKNASRLRPLKIERVECIADGMVSASLDTAVDQALSAVARHPELTGDALWERLDRLTTAYERYVEYAGYSEVMLDIAECAMNEFFGEERGWGVLERIVDLYRRIESKESTAAALTDMAQIFEDYGRRDRARELMEEGLTAARGGDIAEAVDDLERGVKFFEKIGDHRRALEILEELVALEGPRDNDSWLDMRVSRDRAQQFKRLGRDDRARTFFLKALSVLAFYKPAKERRALQEVFFRELNEAGFADLARNPRRKIPNE